VSADSNGYWKLQLREARGHPDANVEPVLSALAVRSQISLFERLVHVLFLADLGGKNEQTPAPTSLFRHDSGQVTSAIDNFGY
jgi:hypothetical protein